MTSIEPLLPILEFGLMGAIAGVLIGSVFVIWFKYLDLRHVARLIKPKKREKYEY